jgi:hypothetical protein
MIECNTVALTDDFDLCRLATKGWVWRRIGTICQQAVGDALLLFQERSKRWSLGYRMRDGGRSYCRVPGGTPVLFQDEYGNMVERLDVVALYIASVLTTAFIGSEGTGAIVVDRTTARDDLSSLRTNTANRWLSEHQSHRLSSN